ncbi:MAG TPA: zinc ABC transporter substrate-binding protein [Actinophytocola sp.]|jgi:zinc/manganese transport system substrate-binding protein|uniref:metal ABC transporter solute-binding protein, Zn/Mn family n=1 Tax=Actinophytocola sp. TaxID=1872138 RepID=UPI002F932249
MSRLSRSVPALAGVAVLALAGCGDHVSDAAADGKIAVVASTNVWGSVVQAVGGNRVGVDSIVDDASGDPHAHPDSPEDAAAVADAALVVFNGGGYDDFFTELIDGTGTDARQVDAFAISGHEVGANEHVWYDLPTVRKVADRIAVELGALDAGHKAMFTANAKTFGARVDAVAARAKRAGEARPGAKVVATEPVAHYLLEAAGLTDVTPPEFSEAIEEETDPPVSAFAATLDLVSGRRVAMLVANAQTQTPVTDSLVESARKAGIPVITVTETLPRGVTGYVEWMTQQVDAIAGALART